MVSETTSENHSQNDSRSHFQYILSWCTIECIKNGSHPPPRRRQSSVSTCRPTGGDAHDGGHPSWQANPHHGPSSRPSRRNERSTHTGRALPRRRPACRDRALPRSRWWLRMSCQDIFDTLYRGARENHSQNVLPGHFRSHLLCCTIDVIENGLRDHK